MTGENDLVMHHEVDSVETIAPYTGDAVAASDGQRCLLAYVVVEEEVSAICYIFRASSETERNTILNTIESALYADVKKFKVCVSDILALSGFVWEAVSGTSWM